MYILLIKEVREEKGITQQELAKYLNISQSYLSELENNKKKNVTFELILKIGEVLNVEIRKIYIATSDIDRLRKELYKSIDVNGINSQETLNISKLLNRIINLEMEENGML